MSRVVLTRSPPRFTASAPYRAIRYWRTFSRKKGARELAIPPRLVDQTTPSLDAMATRPSLAVSQPRSTIAWRT